MGPRDVKGRTVLPDTQITMLSLSMSLMNGHFSAEERLKDEQLFRDHLDTLSAFGYLVMPQSALDGSITAMQKLLDEMKKAAGSLEALKGGITDDS